MVKCFQSKDLSLLAFINVQSVGDRFLSYDYYVVHNGNYYTGFNIIPVQLKSADQISDRKLFGNMLTVSEHVKNTELKAVGDRLLGDRLLGFDVAYAEIESVEAVKRLMTALGKEHKFYWIDKRIAIGLANDHYDHHSLPSWEEVTKPWLVEKNGLGDLLYKGELVTVDHPIARSQCAITGKIVECALVVGLV